MIISAYIFIRNKTKFSQAITFTEIHTSIFFDIINLLVPVRQKSFCCQEKEKQHQFYVYFGARIYAICLLIQSLNSINSIFSITFKRLTGSKDINLPPLTSWIIYDHTAASISAVAASYGKPKCMISRAYVILPAVVMM